VELGEPRWSDDGWEEKLDLALDERPYVVSFTFGAPPADVVAALHEQEIRTWGTVTSVEEARVAAAAGVDTLVVQGAEAGGHRALFVDDDAEPVPLLQLLAEAAAAVDLPLVAAGGIAD
jgi:nitronate monooxygenase